MKQLSNRAGSVLMIAYTNYRTDPRVIRAAESAVNGGFDVDFIALRREGEPLEEMIHGVRVLHVNQCRYRGRGLFQYMLAYLVFFVRCFFKSAILSLKRPYAVVHVNNMPDFLVFCTLIPKLMGSKILLDIHDPMPNTFASKFKSGDKGFFFKLLLWQEKLSAWYSDRVLTVHDPVKDLILVKHGLPPDSIQVIANFADDEIFTLNPDYRVDGKLRLIFHGTILERYGLRTLVEALSKVLFQAIANTGVSNAQIEATIYPSTNGNVGPIYPNVLGSLLGSVAKPNIIFLPSDARNPMIQEYDAIFERQVATNTVVSVSWLGSLAHFLPEPIDTNLPAPTTQTYTISGGPLNGDVVTVPFFKGARPNSQFNQITMIATAAHSIYNAAVLQFNRRFTRGLQFQANYTLADSRDDNAYGLSATPSGNGANNAYNIGFDEGPSPFDVRNRAVISIVYQPQYFANSHGPMHWLLDGWTFAPIQTAQSGEPFTPTVTGNPASGLGATGTGITGSTPSSSRVPFLERNSYRYPPSTFSICASRAPSASANAPICN